MIFLFIFHDFLSDLNAPKPIQNGSLVNFKPIPTTMSFGGGLEPELWPVLCLESRLF